MNRRGGGNRRYDAKKITMRKLVYFDNDLAPRFDEDDEPVVLQTARRGRPMHYCAVNPDLKIKVRQYVENRRDRQLQRGAGGTVTSSAIILNLIKVPRGASLGKDYILRVIGQYIDDFKPILLKVDRGDVVFYVEDDETAQAIKAISRRVKHPQTNQPVTFLVSRVPAGFSPVCESDKRLIEEVLEKRYNPSEHSLDLGEFGFDEVFRRGNVHLTLTRNNVMMAVVDLIDKKYGDVTALSVKGNGLRFLDFFANLTYRIKNLQVLDLSSNKIDHMTELEKLKGWPVRTFYFENNPICSTYKSAETYTSDIHRVFPKVTLLDGIPVQEARTPGMPDLEEKQIEIPSVKPSWYGSEERRTLIEAFVIEFINVYDSPDSNNRKNLINAYEENASFSLMAENLPDAHDKRPFYESYKSYRQCSHNIKLVDKWERYREKILQKGAMDIVVELSKLPRTKHLMDTFLLDVSLDANGIICFTVQGFFQDGENLGSEDLKFFCRNFVVKCKGENKIAVVSDMLFISGVFTERIQRYKALLSSLLKLPANVNTHPHEETMAVAEDAASASTSASVNHSNLTPQQLAEGGDVNVQQQMVEAFSKQSSMKPEWSRKCLEDHHWDFAAAGQAFLTVRDKIPAEAFQQ